jgi:hypothetical protein
MLCSACPQNGVLGAHPSEAQKDDSQRVLNQDRRVDVGEQFTSLLHLLPLCADWCVVCCCCMQQENLIHFSVWPKPSDLFILTSGMSACTALN